MSMFDDLTDVYEAMIDWPKRLAHEEPFYRRLFAEHAVRSVVDTACGTGRHAAMFHSWGLRVEGADLSPGMIDRARANFGEPDPPALGRTRLRRADRASRILRCGGLRGQFAAAVPDAATAERAIGQMLAAVRGGGLLVVQALNLWRLPDGPCIWQKCRQATLNMARSPHSEGRSSLGGRGYVELMVAEAASGASCCEPTPCDSGAGSRGVGVDGPAAGAGEIRFYGGYRDEPYEPSTSADLLMVAIKCS